MALQYLSDDVIALSDGDYVLGDPFGGEVLTLQVGGDDLFQGADGGSYTGIGDGYEMAENSRGGNDAMYGGGHTGTGDPYSFDTGVTYFGDAAIMEGHAIGGRDLIIGGIDSSNMFIGDASDAIDVVRGGNDTLIGGSAMSDAVVRTAPLALVVCDSTDAASNMLIGDFYNMGGGGPQPGLIGRTLEGIDEVHGGADNITGGDAIAMFGNSSQTFNIMLGDAYSMSGLSRGGDDVIHSGNAVASDAQAMEYNFAVGDAIFASDGTITGRDRIFGGDAVANSSDTDAYAFNLLVGDALFMGEGTRANNDQLTGGDANGPGNGSIGGDAYAINFMAGDTFGVGGPFGGGPGAFGNDTITGGNGSGSGGTVNVMYGDVGSSDGIFAPPLLVGGKVDLSTFKEAHPADFKTSLDGLDTVEFKGGLEGVHFGKDLIIGGSGNAMNFMMGDANTIGSDSVGGNDTLIAGDSIENILVGDAMFIGEDGRGGNDRLVSGAGEDQMYGDALEFNEGRGGADRFVFAPKNGNDVVFDFHASERDKIDLSAFKGIDGFHSLGTMIAAGRIEQSDGAVVIHLDLVDPHSDANTVTLVGVSIEELGRGSFNFG